MFDTVEHWFNIFFGDLPKVTGFGSFPGSLGSVPKIQALSYVHVWGPREQMPISPVIIEASLLPTMRALAQECLVCA